MTINKATFRKYNIQVLDNVYPQIVEMREFAENFTGVIAEQDDPGALIKFIDLSPDSNFVFRVILMKHYSGSNHISSDLRIVCEPNDDELESEYFEISIGNDIIGFFKAWISLVITYNQYESKMSPADAIQKKYEAEFKENFILLDESAQFEPFPFDTQIKVIQLLNHIEQRLEKIENKNDEIGRILKETKKLKTEVPNLTKAETVSRLSKIWAWTRKIGFEGFKKVFDVAIEEGVKSIFDGRALLLLHLAHQI